MKINNKISIVAPCYNEEEVLPIFLKTLEKIRASMSPTVFEYVFIDDGSTDGTLEILRNLSSKNAQIKYISFSRNFGKEAALLSGLEAATGDLVAVMDVDLQDPPELLCEMRDYIIKDGFDCVAARRTNRKGEPMIRSFFARMFYKIINKISDVQTPDGARDFRLMTRQAANAVLSLKEYNRFSKGLFSWIGFKTKWLEFENIPRMAGATKWSFSKLFLYSLDGIIAFSVKPLALSSLFGILFCFLSFLGTAFVITRYFMFGDPVAGWASIVTIILFIGGIQLLCIGIIGQYLAKIYLESKNRPVYIIRETSEDLRLKRQIARNFGSHNKPRRRRNEHHRSGRSFFRVF